VSKSVSNSQPQKFELSEGAVAALQARASVLRLAENPERHERHFDDAHDLLSVIESLLKDLGLGFIEDERAADRAFGLTHVGMLEKVSR
jgi:hypothetical protein